MFNSQNNDEKKIFRTKKTKRIRKSTSLIDQIVSVQGESKVNQKVLPGNYVECFPFPRARLNKKTPFRIGRNEGNDLVLPSSDVSRKHAIVSWDSSEGAYVIEDLDSANGVYVNAQFCKRRILKDKDVILIGDYNVCYYVIEELSPNKMLGAETTVLKKRDDIVEKLQLSLKGDLSVLDLSTVLQMIASESKTGYIKIEGTGARGYIHFNQGFVVHSEVGSIKGEEAFFVIMNWTSGKFNFIHDVQPIEFTMNDEVQYLLMEVAQRLDESNKDLS